MAVETRGMRWKGSTMVLLGRVLAIHERRMMKEWVEDPENGIDGGYVIGAYRNEEPEDYFRFSDPVAATHFKLVWR